MRIYNFNIWGRWEWAFSHPCQDTKSLDKIGIWEDDGRIVSVYFLVHPKYNHVKGDMLKYAEENLSKEGKLASSSANILATTSGPFATEA